jgi:transcriptional regulator with XRE-family HTH domain
MESISKRIVEARKSKGLSQEDLAELAKVNLRTIQRIENNENEPRGKTLNLVYDALEIKIENPEILKVKTKIKFNETIIINTFFLIILNLILISITGFLTLDSESNVNSKIGALLLSFFIPFFITYKTQEIKGINRVYKFGGGYIFYILFSAFIIGIPQSFVSALLPCLIISLATLYYGNYFFEQHHK